MADNPNDKNKLTDDGLLPTTHHAVRLPTFEGPLDLLLFLIRKHEINIYDIPIETVTKQYLDIIYNSKSMDLDLTGEFFVMAATLMVIKSRLLLPKKDQDALEEENDDMEEDPRWELVQQLIEYKKIKEQSEKLESLISKSHDILPRNIGDDAPSKDIQRPLKNSDKIELWNAFNKVLKRFADRTLVGVVHEEILTVTDQMNSILQTLEHKPTFLFSSLFEGKKISIHHLVTAFLALLELCRLNKLFLEQTGDFEDIQCIRRDEEPLPENDDSTLQDD